MRRVIITIGLIFIATLLAVIYGYDLQLNNPSGIWLYTPPADGSGKASDPFYVGMAFSFFLSSIIYAASSASAFTWAKIKRKPQPIVVIPLAVASLIGIIAMLISSRLTG